MTTYLITNGKFKTFKFKAKIKKAGGKWTPFRSGWMVDLHKSDSLMAYADRLTFTDTSKAVEPKALTERQFDNLYNEGGEGFNPNR